MELTRGIAMIDYDVVQSLVIAIGIGLLVGVEREKDRAPGTPAGLRTFVLISLLGALSALSRSTVLSAITLAAIGAFMASRHFRPVANQSGFVTDAGALVTFWLGYMTFYHQAIAIMLAVITASALAAKRPLHDFASKRLSELEFYDTLKFLAVVFIIYPVLPRAGFGAGGFLNLRTIWIFVILVSSISYVGYFLTKFLGVERGTLLTAVVGGLASTTASTVSFARRSKDDPQNTPTYALAAIASNTMQLPRLGAILYAIDPGLAVDASLPLLAGTTAGALLTAVLRWIRPKATAIEHQRISIQNPFSLRPALAFGLYFAMILIATHIATERLGNRGVYLTSLLGGSLDVDAVAVSLAGLASKAAIDNRLAVSAVLAAAVGNAVVKLLIASWGGTRGFAVRLGFGAAAVFGSAWAAWLMLLRP
ncbi:MAG: DUF4010 domain-containing protein [Acidobacteriota bacterium]